MTSQLQGLNQPTMAALESHIQGVRLFMRDFTELNLLIKGEESSDRMIAWASMDFLSDFNGTPPFSGYSLDDLWSRNLHSFAVRGTVISLLQSLMILYNRNNLQFSDGGISVGINDKAPMIQAMLGLLQSAYEQQKRQVKTALNIEQILHEDTSGVHSDYLALSSLGYF